MKQTEVKRGAVLLYWVLKLLLVEPFARVATRPWIEGEEHIPSRGPALLVSNHLSASETVLLPGLLRRRMTFPAKVELFRGRTLPQKILGRFLATIKMLPMDRSGGQASASGIAAIRDRLAQGEVVIIFPEGTRSPDGRLYKGRTGTARIVLAAAGVPVIPVAVVNTVPRPRGRFGLPWIYRPGIRVGRALDFSAYAAAGNDRDILRYITDELMNQVMQLSGQVYVDAYATSVKQALRSGSTVAQPTPPRPGFGRPVPPVPAAKAPAA